MQNSRIDFYCKDYAFKVHLLLKIESKNNKTDLQLPPGNSKGCLLLFKGFFLNLITPTQTLYD
jgi:hypothetical protein